MVDFHNIHTQTIYNEQTHVQMQYLVLKHHQQHVLVGGGVTENS